MKHYCTILDKNYLYKGLALYHSLVRHNPTAELFILCMDQETYIALTGLRLKSAHLLKLNDLEDLDLQKAKIGRTIAEYCWTLKPALMSYLFKHTPSMEIISYLDGDLFFFSKVDPIFLEFDSQSILISPHRFPDDISPFKAGSDPYNAGFIAFRNTAKGRRALEWWRERCLEWCYYRREDGKFGDQGYLNDWPSRFSEVHVLKHIGANAAPWNISQYAISQQQGNIFLDNAPLIFYHFQGLKMHSDLTFTPFSSIEYPPLSPLCLSAIYEPYYEALLSVQKNLEPVRPEEK